MSHVIGVPLGDERFFSFVSGLWKTDRLPATTAAVLRSTNFRGDGLFDYEDVALLDVEERQLCARQLQRGDIVIERSGGGPKQPVGRVAFFEPPDGRRYATSNFTTALRVADRDAFDPSYVCLFLHAVYLSGATETLQRATTGIRNLEWAEYRTIEVPRLSLRDQVAIASIVKAAQEAILIEEALTQATVDLKRGAMRELFTRGLRGEEQKETEIGRVPKSWAVGRLDRYASVVSTRMSYSELAATQSVECGEAVRVLGIKVADMNRSGNEVELTHAALERQVRSSVAKDRCAPPRTIIFPKRGAAIATNKKRISREWTAFDPNVIGVIGKTDLKQEFLFNWFQTFDLRTITEPGPTPQLNKKDLDPLIIPVPSSVDEQREIGDVLDAIERKIDLHRQKRAVLDEIFKALLNKLMTGAIRIADLDLSALGAAQPEEAA